VAWQAERQAQAQHDLLGRRHPVLLEHQVPVRQALVPSAGHGAKPAAVGQAGVAGTRLGIDAQTLEIRAIEVTTNAIGDAPMLPELLAQIPLGEPIESVCTDGAYDTRG